ncbi:YchJ family protein [Colwellia sp. 6M3]|uniref:YchJ family protein n=1 Tax=Colwellia sp. 6M3 TaxID=2759849 RepID=UPI0015F5F660|nr:YchJ family protein [Colwellia sp. 6M3]MBA6416509.1 YchJ family protein [Colwellia sp. 6M3]
MQCPCGLELTYAQCCQPLIMATTSSNSPEQLMRSRYSAYATKNAEYIYLTYAKASQLEQSIVDIEQWAAQTKWLKLVIHNASEYQKNKINKESAQVEFSAFYQHQGQIWQMRENSNFVIEDNAWRYLDGEVSDSKVLIKPKRNDTCFCQSNKKFKQCCAKAF